MRKVVRSQTLAYHKRETTMVIYVPSIAMLFVAKTKYSVKDLKPNPAVKHQTHVTT